MAVIYNAQGKRKQQDEQAQQPFSPSAGAAPQTQQPTAAGQPGATAAPKQAGSGGFTNLQTYLKANKAGTANLADTATKAVAGGFDTKVEGPKTESITNTSVNLADTKQTEADLAKTFDEEQYKKELAGGVAGQQAAGASQSSAAGRLAAGDTSQVLSAIGGGRQGLRNLTSFGLQRDPTAQQKFQQAAVDARQRENTLASNIADASKRIADAKQTFTDRQGELKGNINTANKGLQDRLRELAGGLKTSRLDALKADIRSKGLAFEGQSPGEWRRSQDDLINEYIKSSYNTPDTTLADVANADDLQRLEALKRLGSGFDIGTKTAVTPTGTKWEDFLRGKASEGWYKNKEVPIESSVDTKGGRVSVDTSAPVTTYAMPGISGRAASTANAPIEANVPTNSNVAVNWETPALVAPTTPKPPTRSSGKTGKAYRER